MSEKLLIEDRQKGTERSGITALPKTVKGIGETARLQKQGIIVEDKKGYWNALFGKLVFLQSMLSGFSKH